MVRLVTSRLHRCYNTRSLARSATTEKLTTIMHIMSCVGLLSTGNWTSHLLVSPSSSPTPALLRTISIILLTFVHFFDFVAVCTAHIKFYQPSLKKRTGTISNDLSSSSSNSKKVRRSPTLSIIISSPDFVITFLYMFSTLVVLFSTMHYHYFYYMHASSAISLLPPAPEQQREQYLQVRASILFAAFTALASTLNVVLSLPIPKTTSTNNNNVSPTLVRMHNVVSLFFQTASIIKLIALTVISYGVPDPAREIVRLTTQLTLYADVLVAFAASLNLLRISRFLSATHFWALHDAKRLGHVRERIQNIGILGWFKSSRSGNTSDGDSDYGDDVEFSFDGGNLMKQSSKRMSPP